MEQKRISFKLDMENYNRLKQIAKEEYRSLSKQAMIAVKNYILQYEQEKKSCETTTWEQP